MTTPVESILVQHLIDDRIFSFALPSSHRAKWTRRYLEFGSEPHKLESLLPYLSKVKPSALEAALNNAAHALVTGLGLLVVLKEDRQVADIIDLVLCLGSCVVDDSSV